MRGASVVRFADGRYNTAMMFSSLIITIDGPAGSGKSTIAKRLAQRLKVAYLDTGAMYRAVTLAALRANADFEDAEGLAAIAHHCKIEFQTQSAGEDRVLLNGADVTEVIRSTEVTNHAHYIAGAAAIRAELVRQQQGIGVNCDGLVTEGRDQGTVVFPNARFKFYLDASPEVRARRRLLQLQQKNLKLTFEEILKDQQQRDARDAKREVGPLAIPAGACVVDTSAMGIDEVVDHLYRIVTGACR